MKLAASLIVRNELGRYLEPCIDHLLEFCDAIYVLDDGSTDGTYEWLTSIPPGRNVNTLGDDHRFFDHEGHARQRLLEWTVMRLDPPTHVLAIDADELVSDGAALRKLLEQKQAARAWSLQMEEVWEADTDGLCVRMDGGWRPHPVPCVWQVPHTVDAGYRIRDRQLACGRVPDPVTRARATSTGLSLLHFGWANETERAARHDRYVQADGGRFHARRHLDSIMWPCDRVDLAGRSWPVSLEPHQAAVLTGAGLVAA